MIPRSTSSPAPRLRLLGAVGSAMLVSLAAHRARLLSVSGAVAATAVGTATAYGTGASGSATLVTFFATSSLFGKLPDSEVPMQRRGSRRDGVQVLANGGIAALLALAARRAPIRLRPGLLAGFFGAVAAATADTWATEIGSRFGQQPRSIVGGRPVPRGTSGAVTFVGTAASVLGALLIAIVSSRFQRRPGRTWTTAVVIGGVAGSLVDSVSGATLQDVRLCDVCGLETELFVHRCGGATRRILGQQWCSNDVVNALGIGCGALTSLAMAALADWHDGCRPRSSPIRQPS